MGLGIFKKFDMKEYKGEDIEKIINNINSKVDPNLIEVLEHVKTHERIANVTNLTPQDYFKLYDISNNAMTKLNENIAEKFIKAQRY